jgi:uncharacterized SAM-binding protein YcdF (DUF218 family)
VRIAGGAISDRTAENLTRPDLPAGASAPRRRRWVLRTGLALFVAILVTPLAVAFSVWFVARENSTEPTNAIVVLGAAEFDGVPSPVLQARLAHALTLYQDKIAPYIVTVGGKRPGDLYTEAGVGVAWLHQHGVPLRRLVAVETGDDTLQSMRAVGRVFTARDWRTATVVTDPDHELRSRLMADDNGMSAQTNPTRTGPTVLSRQTQVNYIVRETGGILWYELVARWGFGSDSP